MYLKIIYRFLVSGLLLGVAAFVHAQVTSDYAVMLTATVDTSVPSITLKWPHDPVATGFSVFRKAKSSVSWDLNLGTLPGSDSSYTDLNIVADSGYEYKVQKDEPGLTGYGYIYSGFHLPAVESRGKLILLIDSAVAGALSQEIRQLMLDISGDGWIILRHDIPSGTTVPKVRQLIRTEVLADPAAVKSLFLLGHVPVPYSGDSAADGHTDHQGAWPADVYYADPGGSYTDLYVNDVSAARTENHNVPGDGKWDQSLVPDLAGLESGRVDLFDMPSFTLSEVNLLKRYLAKDHAFRTRKISPLLRGLIDDQFGVHGGEAFAANGWRNFPVMVGRGNVEEKSYFATLQSQSYIWSYACGGGWYQGAGGVGSTTDFANDSIHTVFTLLFGSYFGDWDNQDNFLRAPLASSGYALACAWAGRPNWQFHHMALGGTIGYCTRLSQNNTGTYLTGFGVKGEHMALMGDPTLRFQYIAPVGNVSADYANDIVTVTWNASPETVMGYYVYRSQQQAGAYTRITPMPVTDLSIIDSLPPPGMNYYMVRALKLTSTPSGSYYNLSTGITDSVMVFTSVGELFTEELPKIMVFPNPANDHITLEFDRDLPGTSRILISDPSGKELMTDELSDIRAYLPYPLRIGGLSQGLYFITIRMENGSVTRKLQVIR